MANLLAYKKYLNIEHKKYWYNDVNSCYPHKNARLCFGCM